MKMPDLSATELFAPPAVVLETRTDGSMILRSPVEYRQSSRSVPHWLEHGATQYPDRDFIGEREGSDKSWSRISYGQAWKQVRAIATWLLGQNLSAERPLVILSDNSIDHALLALATMTAGVPVATMAIGKAGATNAGIYAAQLLGINDEALTKRIASHRENMRQIALESSSDLV